MNPVCAARLVIEVSDVPGGWEGAMTIDQAEEIVAFVRNLPPLPTLYIHCRFGESRSAAVAAALSKAWTGDEGMFWAERHPNKHVYELVLEATRRAASG